MPYCTPLIFPPAIWLSGMISFMDSGQHLASSSSRGWASFLFTIVDRSGRPSQYRSIASLAPSMTLFWSQ